MRYYKKPKITFFNQLESTDCGAACLAMIISYHGKKVTLSQVKEQFEFTRIGVSIQDIVEVASNIGFQTTPLKLTQQELEEIPLPSILFWKQDHFVVLEKITYKKGQILYHILDPGYGKIILESKIFVKEWQGNNEKGVGIVFQETENFKKFKWQQEVKKSISKSPLFRIAFTFLKINKWKYLSSIILLIISLITSFFIPFTFQKIIDSGINLKEIHVVYYFLVAQMVLFISSFISDFLSTLFLTKINYQLSILLKVNLLLKLMRLPIRFFDTRLNTETLQRIQDQNKIQNFITWKGIDFSLSIFNILIFSSLLCYFNPIIFSIYTTLSVFSIIWVVFFLRKRAMLEYAMFLGQSENSNGIYEFVMNMPEIKINHAQYKTVNKILDIQKKINKLELRNLFLNMYQNIGVEFLSKFKEIIAIAICAYFIIKGEMTLGTLLSISYIIGQLTTPIQNLVTFVRDTQDTSIANKRISTIYDNEEEDHKTKINVEDNIFKTIKIKEVSFKYPGNFNPFVLENISFSIPQNSITAIVGASGSGKTSLLKLLLSYYPSTKGNIQLDELDLEKISANDWRKKCGIVLQDGKIFSGTIAENIAISDEIIDETKLINAAKMANILELIKILPMGFNTKVGNSGIELSGGQKQRILIARAVYKNPEFIFFDEATSALDAENEKIIHDNLQMFFKGKTVVIIAHRLSTVKKADQIIVLKQGQLVEKGNHQELVDKKGDYFNLVKNQLELGNG
ncbi:Toxin RTX-I translocation ATP-binding protein [Flavobacterium columnare]|uniref:Toxin RTX-I translocation ATP-binding protein n=1 Tax=Flavobacterium columnare TaxID=996 RepID=A0A2N9PEG8_9FLAO|nr:peptidase domain-containing ABC transporter [Flavobacterium columnare]SPE78713.1 Toxin RTX-I translocation ATP-binding protein [Flavobacterium columnare]